MTGVDWGSSPTLSAVRAVAGEAAAHALVAVRGGTSIYLPEVVTADCQLARIVGVDAAAKIVDHLGGHRTIDIPTGRGHRHGRRVDHAEVRRLRAAGWTIRQIARVAGCTARQVHNILANEPDRQIDLFGQ